MATNGFNKQKVKGFIDEWQKIEDEASAKIGAIMSKVKSAKDNILEHAEGIGIKRKVMRNIITEVKLREKADAMRDEFAENNDEDMIDQRDNVALAAGLTLFDAAGIEAPESKKKAAKPDPKAIADKMDEIAKAVTDETQH